MSDSISNSFFEKRENILIYRARDLHNKYLNIKPTKNEKYITKRKINTTTSQVKNPLKVDCLAIVFCGGSQLQWFFLIKKKSESYLFIKQ